MGLIIVPTLFLYMALVLSLYAGSITFILKLKPWNALFITSLTISFLFFAFIFNGAINRFYDKHSDFQFLFMGLQDPIIIGTFILYFILPFLGKNSVIVGILSGLTLAFTFWLICLLHRAFY